MTVATLRLDLRLRDCVTLKDTRRQMQGIMGKLRKHFNVSVAEAEGAADPSLTVLVVAAVGRSRRDARETLERVSDAVLAHPRAEVLRQAITEV